MAIPIYISTRNVHRVPFSPYPYQNVVFFLMPVILTGMRHIIVILICIFLMISDHIEQLLCQTGIFFFFNNKAVKSIFLFEKVLQRIYYNLLLIRWEAECDKNSLLLKHSPRMLLPIFPSHPISVTLVLKEFKMFQWHYWNGLLFLCRKTKDIENNIFEIIIKLNLLPWLIFPLRKTASFPKVKLVYTFI